MKKLCGWIILVVLLIGFMPAKAEETWSFEAFTGTAYNFTTPLTIHQSGEDDININARYDTNPLRDSPYYAMRIGRWKENRAWEVEVIHHKLYLRNKPSEVQKFEISHGYNFLTINRAWEYTGFIYRLGVGALITHPETTIRGRSVDAVTGATSEAKPSGGDFHLSGAAAQIAAGKRFYLWKKLFITIEGKVIAAYGRIPIEDGYADVPNVGVHGLLGVGYDF